MVSVYFVFAPTQHYTTWWMNGWPYTGGPEARYRMVWEVNKERKVAIPLKQVVLTSLLPSVDSSLIPPLYTHNLLHADYASEEPVAWTCWASTNLLWWFICWLVCSCNCLRQGFLELLSPCLQWTWSCTTWLSLKLFISLGILL